MATKEEILTKALDIFAAKGYSNTNIEEIASKVGITKPAVYYYFKSKKELYNEIFTKEFSKLSFEKQKDFENNIKTYIYSLGHFFIKHPQIARLFSKELSCEAKNLNNDTLKIISKTLRFLTSSLEDRNINPLFIQTLVVSSFTTYSNTLKLRERITGIINDKKLTENFDITEEIYRTIINYIKAHK